MSKTYEEMLRLPHPTSPRHPRMPMESRAAQFAPFAALTGYEDAIDETARLTDSMLHLSEDAKQILDLKQLFLTDLAEARPTVVVTYFLRDSRKEGGAYRKLRGCFKEIDANQKELVMEDGARIPVDRILDIECELFGGLFS